VALTLTFAVVTFMKLSKLAQQMLHTSDPLVF